MHNTRSKPYNGRLHVTNKKLYTQDKWNLMLLTDMLWITINLYAMDHYYFFMYFQSAFSLVLNSLYIQIWSIGSIHAKAFWFFFLCMNPTRCSIHPEALNSLHIQIWPYLSFTFYSFYLQSLEGTKYSCQSFLIFIDWANPLSYLSIPDWYNQKIGWEVHWRNQWVIYVGMLIYHF